MFRGLHLAEQKHAEHAMEARDVSGAQSAPVLVKGDSRANGGLAKAKAGVRGGSCAKEQVSRIGGPLQAASSRKPAGGPQLLPRLSADDLETMVAQGNEGKEEPEQEQEQEREQERGLEAQRERGPSVAVAVAVAVAALEPKPIYCASSNNNNTNNNNNNGDHATGKKRVIFASGCKEYMGLRRDRFFYDDIIHRFFVKRLRFSAMDVLALTGNDVPLLETVDQLMLDLMCRIEASRPDADMNGVPVVMCGGGHGLKLNLFHGPYLVSLQMVVAEAVEIAAMSDRAASDRAQRMEDERPAAPMDVDVDVAVSAV